MTGLPVVPDVSQRDNSPAWRFNETVIDSVLKMPDALITGQQMRDDRRLTAAAADGGTGRS